MTKITIQEQIKSESSSNLFKEKVYLEISGQFPYSKVKTVAWYLKLSVKWSNRVKTSHRVTMKLVFIDVLIDDTFKIIYWVFIKSFIKFSS